MNARGTGQNRKVGHEVEGHAVAVPILALVFVAAAVAKNRRGHRRGAGRPAAIACGKTRTIGVAAPITSPAASIGRRSSAARSSTSSGGSGEGERTRRSRSAGRHAASHRHGVRREGRAGVHVQPEGARGCQPRPAARRASLRPPRQSPGARPRLRLGHARLPRDGSTDGVNQQGTSSASVPNDGMQGPTVANYIKRSHAKSVFIIDDPEACAQGLANMVQATLKAKGVNVARDSVSQDTSDFSSLIAKVPSSTDVVYIPWQLFPKAQAFGQAIKAEGTGGRAVRLLTACSIRPPGRSRARRLVLPVATGGDRQGVHEGSRRRRRELRCSLLVAAQVALDAIAGRHGTARPRAKVRNLIRTTNIPEDLSLLGVQDRLPGDRRSPPRRVQHVPGPGNGATTSGSARS